MGQEFCRLGGWGALPRGPATTTDTLAVSRARSVRVARRSVRALAHSSEFVSSPIISDSVRKLSLAVVLRSEVELLVTYPSE